MARRAVGNPSNNRPATQQLGRISDNDRRRYRRRDYRFCAAARPGIRTDHR